MFRKTSQTVIRTEQTSVIYSFYVDITSHKISEMSCNAQEQSSLLNHLDEGKFLTILTGFTFAVIGVFIFIFSSYVFFDRLRIPKGSTPTVPFGNFKDVFWQNVMVYDYLRQYYNRFRRKGYGFAGLFILFTPAVLIVDLKLVKDIFDSKRENVKDVLSDDDAERYFRKLVLHKDKLLTNLQAENALLDNLEAWTTSYIFSYVSKLMNESAIRSVIQQKIKAISHLPNMVYPFFRNKIRLDKEITYFEKIIEYNKKHDIKSNNFLYSLSEKNNIQEYLDVILDSILYTRSSVIWGLYELACNMDVQEDLIGEIRRFNNEEQSAITMEKLEKLPYLDSVVKEILRKYPPVPADYKTLSQIYEIKDQNSVKLPKNLFVMASILGIHRDPDFYLDPENFDPDRFFEDKKFMNTEAYIPFGFGKMSMIGSRLGVLSTKMAIYSILSSYKATISKNINSFDKNKLNYYPKEPLPIKLESTQMT